MQEIYSEVRCDYNNDQGFWTVDAWRNPEDEEGKVIAVINDKTGDVYYCEPEAHMFSPLAQEVIKQKVEEIKSAAKKLYLVVRDQSASSITERVICGAYHKESDAIERVNEVFTEEEERFEEVYEGAEWTSVNHNNGHAELHYGDEDFDNVLINVIEVEADKPIVITMYN